MENIYAKTQTTKRSKAELAASIARPSANSILIIKQFARTYSPSMKN
ncbi:MAG TPA: hypothetical protein IAA99_07095 [Candidatus Avibacteroides faecavium]|nr:hypothetical protein [Candidatus Avibacteroides faecavium]